ncbi:hypothetical protein PEP31012_01728 [Pandoraea eparura]|uniref:Uncharacterized protein n=1 Tax=Pandoraea eparura TaxID=2508291 RepID=A0A5E4U5X3_9BURK|nr:hypothetical protein PEP31012_01728 [Pandoraea eparura]
MLQRGNAASGPCQLINLGPEPTSRRRLPSAPDSRGSAKTVLNTKRDILANYCPASRLSARKSGKSGHFAFAYLPGLCAASIPSRSVSADSNTDLEGHIQKKILDTPLQTS